MVPIGDHHGQGIAAHHVLIGPGAADGEDVLQRDVQALRHVAQRLSLRGARRHDIEKLAERGHHVGGQLLLAYQGDDVVERGRLARVVEVGKLERRCSLFGCGLRPGRSASARRTCCGFQW